MSNSIHDSTSQQQVTAEASLSGARSHGFDERSSTHPDGAELSLPEMLRVLDVARQLRESRQTAQQALRRDQLRDELRHKLKETASVTGEPVSDAEIDAAIDHYFDTMHVFRAPQPGFSTFLAHAYVLRRRIAVGAAGLVLVIGVFWMLFAN